MAPPSSPPTARVVPVPHAWDGFVERYGLTTSLALMVSILAVTTSRQHPTDLTTALAGPQLLLVLIVLGCVGVLAFRSFSD